MDDELAIVLLDFQMAIGVVFVAVGDHHVVWWAAKINIRLR